MTEYSADQHNLRGLPTFSNSHISNSRCSTCLSVSFAYLRIAHRLCIGSMILFDMLHASANRVVFEKISIVRRRACCAPGVMLSASSRMTILCRPGGSVTFF